MPTLLRTLLFVALTVSPAYAVPVTVVGEVAATTSRWEGDAIVTASKVTTTDGQTIDVVQLGGVVNGLGMAFSHQPALLHAGEAIELELAPRADGSPRPVVRALRVAPATPGVATYGVQRTAGSETPLWHASGCLDIIHDTTVSSAVADVLDASFGAWATATEHCGGLSFTSERRANVPTTIDKLSTVHVRTERWCRPATSIAQPELCYAPDVAAVTRLVYVDNPADPDDGKILEADMELNAVNFELLLPGQTPTLTTKPALDLQSIATHEAGHVLGLAHDCGTGLEPWPTDRDGRSVPACDGLASDSGVVASTMYYKLEPGDERARSVEASDAAGACAIAPAQACEPDIVGGCAASGGSSLAMIVIPLLVLCRRRRSPLA